MDQARSLPGSGDQAKARPDSPVVARRTVPRDPPAPRGPTQAPPPLPGRPGSRSTPHLTVVPRAITPSSAVVAGPAEDAGPPVRASRLPLPPPTDLGVERPRLRRDISVIAEAAASKSGLARAHEAAWRAGSRLLDRAARGSSRLASGVSERALEAIQRFEALPRAQQISWVAAPYAVVLILALALFELRSAAPVTPAAEHIPPAALPVRAPDPPPSAATQAVPAAASATPADAPPTPMAAPEPPPVPSATGEPAGEWRTLPVSASLRSRPDRSGLRVLRLKAGARVKLHEDFPTRPGWVLVEREQGDVGFVSRSRLEAAPAPPARPRTPVRPRKLRPGRPDPFTELERTRPRPR